MSHAIASLTAAGIAARSFGASAEAGSSRLASGTTLAAQAGLDASLVDAISISAVPCDIASYGAILGSIKSTGGNFAYGSGEAAALHDVMTMIGKTLSQGQGGYYIAINAPAGTLMTAMTPGQLQAYMQSDGTLYPNSVVSSDGHTYSVFGLLKQAFASSERTERLRAIDPELTDPRLQGAELLLDQMKADSAPKGSMARLLFGSDAPGRDKAKTIRTLVLGMDGSTSKNGVMLTLIYYPPGVGNYMPMLRGQATDDSRPTTLQLAA